MKFSDRNLFYNLFWVVRRKEIDSNGIEEIASIEA